MNTLLVLLALTGGAAALLASAWLASHPGHTLAVKWQGRPVKNRWVQLLLIWGFWWFVICLSPLMLVLHPALRVTGRYGFLTDNELLVGTKSFMRRSA